MKFLDLFAGIGGFRLGLEQAGHECVGYVEIDKFARKSYQAIHDTEGEWTAHDITTVTDDDIRRLGDRGRVDIIAGGFPCQSFSVAGKRGGFGDTRGTLFFDIMRFADILRPCYLFLENVTGLLNHKTPLSHGLIHKILLTDLYDWRSIWGENQSTQEAKWSLSNVIMNHYIQEILEVPLENQNPKLEVMLTSALDTVTGKTERGQKNGLIGNYKSLPTQIKRLMKNIKSCRTELKEQLDSKSKDLDMSLNKLFTKESLSITDMSMLEEMADTTAGAESLLKKCLAENFQMKKLFITLTEKKMTTDQKTCLFALQELSILISIIKASFYSENLLNEVSFGSIEREESINYVNTFGIIVKYLAEIGYDCEWQTLNSKDFGVPQNRDRLFIIGHLRGSSAGKVFPVEGTDGKPIKIAGKLDGNFRSTNEALDPSGVSTCLNTMSGGDREPKILQSGRGNNKGGKHDICPTITSSRFEMNNHVVQPVLTPDREEKRQNGRRFKGNGEPMFTLTSQDRHGVMVKNVGGMYTQTSPDFSRGPLPELSRTLKANKHDAGITDGYRIRKLTPKECWRLQGFPDWAFDRAAEVNSDSQLYKQAGNSVTVNVIHEIARRMKGANP